ncbi:M20/M25/M40 family metallo-hydrolase [Sphingorhabdus sp. 109]|jgi:acetylornithine deacetylase/succinyl-diaminopimelate desuccinylase-like protein|uniref:M20/M25/M40 family metallo-hydrolase n=1 Tax=Sphingorhabdus sp. 109 TaxID=2653173 RepID=UPI0012F423F4|nr:M20/M25/M40 family metallo-hydrolase [Sphingorhabdus sp. 109]VWX59017.1 putative succinyl-diaminopimelate desuccinylase [Sphingorhabdus sp. 109]
MALALVAGALSVPPALAQDDVVLTAHEQMARDIYRDIIAFRTARGQQQVPAMVSYLVDRFKKAGFDDGDIRVTDYDSDGEKTQGLMVTYRARPGSTAKPIVLLGHMDVVDALAKDWVRPPFTLTEEEGYFFGRATMDNKYGITNLTSTFLRLKAEGWQPSRDLVLVFSGDEESGMVSTEDQAEYVAKNIDPAFILNSDAGGIALAENGTPVAFRVQSAEKTFATFHLTATNAGGHSSRPRADNAIYELAEALTKIAAYKFPVRATDLTRQYFATAGKLTPGETGRAMLRFAADPTDAAAIATLQANPETVGTLGTTCVATMLEAGHAENALPQSATATVNCRIFPGVSAAATEARLKKIIGNDNIMFTLMTDVTESPESKLRDEVKAALRYSVDKRYPGLTILPYMESGGTDGMHYRNLGYDTVAVSGAAMKASDIYAHGLNERLPVASFYDGLDHWYWILKKLAE